MMTVAEVSRKTGVSVRTLQYYDRMGLLPPAQRTEAGYRLYDDAALERLQQILLFRELEFPLREIREILNRPDFDRDLALEHQIELLSLRKEHIEGLIRLARDMKKTGVRQLDFSAFDTRTMDEYAARARAEWSGTREYHEFEKKDQGRTVEDRQKLAQAMMDIFRGFLDIRDKAPDGPEARAQVEKLRAFISEHFYACSEKMLLALGAMYAGGGEFTENINREAGDGAAQAAARAIEACCRA